MPGYRFLPGRSAGLLISLLATLVLAACSGGGGSPPPQAPVPVAVNATVTVNWTASPDAEVNAMGGGYRVYYSSNAGFALTDAGVQMVDVPYNGIATPTTAQLNINLSGTWYIKVVAYSALTPPGGNGGSVSTPTTQLAVVVPAP